MASYLRPRRGKKATAESQNIILKKGEVFFEVPTGGVGKGIGKIKMGDGTTAYKSLPDNAALLKKIVTGAKLNVITGAIKNLLSNLNTSVTQLNNDLAYFFNSIFHGNGYTALKYIKDNNEYNLRIDQNGSATYAKYENNSWYYQDLLAPKSYTKSNNTQGNIEYDLSNHTHSWNNITGKPSSFTPSSHTHDDRYYTESEMNSKLSGKSDTNHSHSWSSITNRPSTFTPSSHSHGWGDITGKPSTYTPSSHTHDERYYTESEINNKGFVSSTANGYIHVNTINKFSDSDNILYGCSNGRNYIVAVTIWSDEKLKTNVDDSDINAINIINKIKLHKFDFINKEYGGHNNCGYIAQELKSIFPEIQKYRNTFRISYYTLNFNFCQPLCKLFCIQKLFGNIKSSFRLFIYKKNLLTGGFVS